MLSKNQVVISITAFLSLICISNVYALSHSMPLHLKVSQSSLVVIGTVMDGKLLARWENWDRSDKQPKSPNEIQYSHAPHYKETVGIIYQVKIKEVLFVSEPLRKKLKNQKVKEIRVIHLYPFLEGGPIFLKGKEHLLFVREMSLKPSMVKEFYLGKEIYYESTDGIYGTYRLDVKTADTNIRKSVERNVEYAKLTKNYSQVKSIRNEVKQMQRWQELLNSPNLKLRQNAQEELERRKEPEKYKLRWRGYKNAQW